MNAHLQEGMVLFNQGEFFRCHEVLEEAWRAELGPLRQFLQAVIHLAVGLYHYEHGNQVGAVRQLTKGVNKLEAYLPHCEGVDTARLQRDANAARRSIENGVPLIGFPRIERAADEQP